MESSINPEKSILSVVRAAISPINFFFVVLLVLTVICWALYDPDIKIFHRNNQANGDTHQFKNFSGKIIVNEDNSGSVTEFLVGGGEVKLVSCSFGCSDLSDPNSGTITYDSENNWYVWTQTKYPDPTNFTFYTLRLRGSA